MKQLGIVVNFDDIFQKLLNVEYESSEKYGKASNNGLGNYHS